MMGLAESNMANILVPSEPPKTHFKKFTNWCTHSAALDWPEKASQHHPAQSFLIIPVTPANVTENGI